MHNTWRREPGVPQQPVAGPSSRPDGYRQGPPPEYARPDTTFRSHPLPPRPIEQPFRPFEYRQRPPGPARSTLRLPQSYGVSRHNHPLPPWQQRRGSQHAAQSTPRPQVPAYAANAGIASYRTATKSSYPSVHLSSTSLLQDDSDDVSRRASTMTSRRAQIATAAARKTAVPRMSPEAGRYYVVDGKLVELSNSPEEMSSSAEEESSDDAQHVSVIAQRGKKSSARVRPVSIPRDTPDTPVRRTPSSYAPRAPPLSAARKRREIIVISSDSEPDGEANADAEPPLALLAAAMPYRIGIRLQQRKRLPFLVRNLRRSFLEVCRRRGVRSQPASQPQQPMQIVYRYSTDRWANMFGGRYTLESRGEHREFVSQWKCPLCDLLGILNTGDMLRFHLRHDHADVNAEWKENHDSVQVTLEIPEIDELEASDEEEQINQYEEVEEEEVEEESQAEGLNAELEDASLPPESHTSMSTSDSERPRSPSPIETDSPPETREQTPPRIRRSHTPSTGYDIVLKHEYEPMHFQRYEPPVMPRTGINWDTQELIPPPQSDPYGPAAEPPLESCRPGGARIYDLLNEESLDRFGILAWSIVDREEEIYEHSDLTDGDKAILALWNRWIFFNRTRFTFHGYYNGAQGFIDEYYKMIHRAAGWRSLRNFLTMLSANRLITLREVLKLLKHYEGKVKMKEWYREPGQNGGAST